MKEDIVLKNQDDPGPGTYPFVQTLQVGVENTLLAVMGVSIDQDKFHLLPQAHFAELFSGLALPVGPVLQGYAVNCIKIVPRVGMCCDSGLGSCIGEE